MATYVMSDIHGCYGAFSELLDKSGYKKDEDELIIAGDIIDRGPENLKMLEYAHSAPKGVTFLMGNHDYDFMKYCNILIHLYSSKKVSEDVSLQELVTSDDYYYTFRNNVMDYYDTIYNLIKQNPELSLDDFKRWKSMIKKFPYYIKKKINGKDYIIVHAGYITEENYDNFKLSLSRQGIKSIEMFYMWARDESVLMGGEPDTTVVFGHTPTITDTLYNNCGKVFRANLDHKRFINIDCGYVFKKFDKYANLACIRLDDEKIFYLL